MTTNLTHAGESHLPDDLGMLALRYLDNLLSPEETGRLNDSLLGNVVARERFVSLCIDLELLREGDILSQLKTNRGSAPPSSPARVLVARAAKRAAAGSLVGMAWDRPWAVSLSVAMVCMIFFLAAASFIRYSNRPHLAATNDGGEQLPFVARFVANANCVWANGNSPQEVGSRLHKGQLLQLQSGLAVFRMDSGARLILEGPAVLRMDDPNAVHLESGSLVSRVPPPAKGFLVDTPTAQVVDLGTEFGLRTDGEDFVDIEVFDGEVELRPRAANGRNEPNEPERETVQSIRLYKGEGARFNASQGTITRDPKHRYAYARDWPSKAGWELWPQLSFHDDFSSDGLREYRGFDFAGLGGDASASDGKLRISPNASSSHGVVLADGRHFLWPGQIFSIDLGPHRGGEDNPTVFAAFKPQAPQNEEIGVYGWRIRRVFQGGATRLDLHQKQFFHRSPAPAGNIRLMIARETSGLDFQFYVLDLDDPAARPVHLGSHSLAGEDAGNQDEGDFAKRPMYVGVTAYRGGQSTPYAFEFDNLRIEPWGEGQ